MADTGSQPIDPAYILAHLRLQHHMMQSLDLVQYKVGMALERMVKDWYAQHALSEFTALATWECLNNYLSVDVIKSVTKPKMQLLELEPRTFRLKVRYTSEGAYTVQSLNFYLEMPELD